MSVKELSKVSTSAEHGKASITKFVFSIGLSLSGGIFEGAIRTLVDLIWSISFGRDSRL